VSWTRIILAVAAAISGVYVVLYFLSFIRIFIRDAQHHINWPQGHINWTQFFFRTRYHAAEFYVGTTLILTTLALRASYNFWLDIVESFVLVTGFQMALSAIGIRFELFSNNPTE
jgi:hypothetical protein